MTKVHTAWLGLGGNLGDPRNAMATALKMLDADPKTRVRAASSLYITPPWGKTDQPDFLNACAAIDTRHSPREILQFVLNLEQTMKRDRGERWGPRTLDIDVLVHSAGPVDEPGLEVPHPRMIERAFVLAPLSEIAPDLVVNGKTITKWLASTEMTGIRKTGDQDWWLE